MSSISSTASSKVIDADYSYGIIPEVYEESLAAAVTGTTQPPLVNKTALAMRQEDDDNNCGAGLCNKNAFPFKLYRLLEDAEEQNFDDIVSWVHEGAAFKVFDSNAFVSRIMPNYFNHSSHYDSFRRQVRSFVLLFRAMLFVVTDRKCLLW